MTLSSMAITPFLYYFTGLPRQVFANISQAYVIHSMKNEVEVRLHRLFLGHSFHGNIGISAIQFVFNSSHLALPITKWCLNFLEQNLHKENK